MKKVIFVLLALSASPLYAQCPGGCPTRFGYTRQVYQAVQPCQAVQQCAIQACAPVATVQPCAPIQASVETVQPCAPIETTIEPCAPVETVEPCAPVEQCETCEYTPSIVAGKTTIGQCVNGSCPVATGTRNVVSNTLKGVAALLDRVNQTRARYGLAALQVADLGAQRQAAYCASTGTLTHGSGVAEILAQNSQGIETAIQQWLNSPGHRALLLNGSYRYADVGVVRSGGRVWCAVRFR